MKTIFVINKGHSIKYAILSGDYSHLNDVWVDAKGDRKKQAELYSLIFAEEIQSRLLPLNIFPRNYLINNPQTPIVSCGMAF